MAMQVVRLAREFLQEGHEASAREAFLRASNYYRSAEVFLAIDDPRRLETWQQGTDAFEQMAALSGGSIQRVEIPFEDGALPGYWCRVDASGAPRPALLVQSGLDGTMEDLFPTIISTALTRGYNCLAYEGPGQGRVIRVQETPFRPNWETVVTPVVDYVLHRPEVDPGRVALIGYSMGGYLAPRAAAYEHRLRACVANAGVFDVLAGVVSTFSEELRNLVKAGGEHARDSASDTDSVSNRIDEIVLTNMKSNPSTRQFIGQMLFTFGVGSPASLFRALKEYSMRDCIELITCETLVVNSSDDKVAGSYEQAKQFYAALKCPKTYLELTDAHGAEKHCQVGAQMVSNEHILNWLDDRLQ
jgi:alpha-beta hydrolase superfamily lysophospholipase